jgi:diacylglycerol kinase family enzyme
MTVEIFKQIYDFNNLSDVEQDITEAFDRKYNPKVPADADGEFGGSFTVTITYTPGEANE